MSIAAPLVRRAALVVAGSSLLAILPAGAQAPVSLPDSAGLVGGAVGPKALDALVSVVGHYGTPQPKAWEFTLVDPGARGGVRTLKATGRRASAKAPDDGGYESSVPLGFFRWSDVKIDAVSAFHAADLEARSAMIGFDSVHYVLRAREGTPSPIWFLTLWDAEERTVGRLEISATSGKVERRVWLRYLGDNDVPSKIEDSLAPYASMRPLPPAPPQVPVPPSPGTLPPTTIPPLPGEPPAQVILPGVQNAPVAPPLPEMPSGSGLVPPPPPAPAPQPPPLPETPAPAPESAPGYTPLPN